MPKIQISPGQGLLLLMDHYKDNETKLTLLKKLYLSGAITPEHGQEIRKQLSDEKLSVYEVLYDTNTINNDPTRRYFETHLAYETLKTGLSKVNIDDLRQHLRAIPEILPKEFRDEVMISAQPILEGVFIEKKSDNFEIEFASYIAKLKEGKLFEKLSPEDREKIELLIKCAVLAVEVINWTEFPLDIYNTDVFSKDYKGKILNREQDSTRSQHLGLMKGHMPLPGDDVALDQSVTPYTRPADQSTFNPEAGWVKENFDRLVHPFSNSISGTELAQLRVIAKLKNDGKSSLTESGDKMARYHQLFVSALLFGSGGHTFHEFIEPLTLPSVKKEFESIPGFDDLNLESMLLTGNEAAFDSALQDTIKYNRMILLRRNLHGELKNLKARDPSLAVEQIELKRNLIHGICSKMECYADKIEKQGFVSKRVGAKKNEMIRSHLKNILNLIQKDEIVSANNAIIALKEQIRTQFGTTDFFGTLSDSLQLIASVEYDVTRYQSTRETLGAKPDQSPLSRPT